MWRANHPALQLLTALVASVGILIGAQARGDGDESVDILAMDVGELASRTEGTAQAELLENAAAILLLQDQNRVFLKSDGAGEYARFYSVVSGSVKESPDKDALFAASAPADDIAFDGSKLRGANFGYIDSIIGFDGLPIGMDRQIPSMIVPVATDAANTLAKIGEDYRRTKEAAQPLARINRLHTLDVSQSVISDGIYMRPYAGRFDDWYFRLVQQGDATSTLQFYGILDGLPERSYHPVTGAAKPESVSPLWFSISDIFSEGASDSVRRFRAEKGGIGRNPFDGYAWRLMPFVSDQIRNLPKGAPLRVSNETIQAAVTNRKRYSPPAVIPIVRDPSRFIGSLLSDYTPVANVAALRSEVEQALALPERSGSPATNDVLTNPDALQAWEAPDQGGPPPQIPKGKAMSPPPADSVVESAPPRAVESEVSVARAVFARPQVVVLSPTIEQAEGYVQKIAESDQQISANTRTLNRLEAYLRWFTKIEQRLKQIPSAEELEGRVTQQISALKIGYEEVARIRNRSLQLRKQLRDELLDHVRSEQYRKLQELSAAPASL